MCDPVRGHPLARPERPIEGAGSGDKPAAADWPEQGPSLISADALAQAGRPGSGHPEREAVPNRHPLPSPFARPLHRWAVWVFHLDPIPRWPGAIRRCQTLRHDALQAHLADLPEYGGAVGVGVLVEFDPWRHA
jgi:hypothetical protein